MNRSQPFARAIAMMAAITAAMGLDGIARRAALNNIGPYRSRGKGRGTPERRYIKKSGKHAPFNTSRQDARTASKYYMAIVNGFEIMQTRSSKAIAHQELRLAA